MNYPVHHWQFCIKNASDTTPKDSITSILYWFVLEMHWRLCINIDLQVI